MMRADYQNMLEMHALLAEAEALAAEAIESSTTSVWHRLLDLDPSCIHAKAELAVSQVS